VKNFQPYFYSDIPKLDKKEWSNDQLLNLQEGINERVHKKKKSLGGGNHTINLDIPDAVVKIEVVHRIDLRGYKTEEVKNKSRFFKITTKTPNIVSSVRKLFHSREIICGMELPPFTYESNILFPLRFMIDNDLTGMGWFRIKKGMYRVKNKGEKNSYCQLEIETTPEGIEPIPPND